MQRLAGWLWRVSGPMVTLAALLFVAGGGRLSWSGPRQDGPNPVVTATPAAVEHCAAATAGPTLAGATPEAAMDQCLHKVEGQLRRYKERVQNHKGETPGGGTPSASPDLPDAPDGEPEAD